MVLSSSVSSNTWRARTWNVDDGNYRVDSYGRAPQTNQWVHLAAVFDDTKDAVEILMLYVNGKNVAFVLKLLDFVLQMFDFVLKMLDFGGIPWSHDAVDATVMPNLMKGGSATCTVGCHYWSASNPQYRADGTRVEGKYV